KNDVTGAESSAASSLTFNVSTGAYQVQAAAAIHQMSTIASDSTLSATAAQQAFQKSLAYGINAALTATHIAPDNYQNWLALANLYATVVPLQVDGAYDNAKSAYAKAEALNPTSPAIPYAVAQLEIAAKNAKAAETALTQSISLKQDYTPAIFLLSQLEVATGNIKEALAAAEAAAYFTPTDPNVLFQVGILRAATSNFDGAISALSSAVAANAEFANA